MMHDEDPYSVLNVPRSASNSDIKKAFRELALKLHPDKNPLGSHLFKRVNRAYQILGDEISRKEFDDQHPLSRKPPAAAPATPAAYTASAATSASSYTFRPNTGNQYNSSSSTGGGSASSMPGARPGSASQQRTAAFRFPSAEQTSFTSSQQFKEAGLPPPSPSHSFHYSSSTGGFTPKGSSTSSRPSSSSTTAQPAPAQQPQPEEPQKSSSFSMPSQPQHSSGGGNGGATVAEELASMRARYEAAQKVDMTAWDRIRKHPLGAPSTETPQQPPPSSEKSAQPPPIDPISKSFPPRQNPTRTDASSSNKEEPPASSRPVNPTRSTGHTTQSPNTPLSQPPPPPPPVPSEADELLNAFKRKAQSNAPQPPSPVYHPSPQSARPQEETAQPASAATASRPPPRPFSAGLTRHNIARSATPNSGAEGPQPPTPNANATSARCSTPMAEPARAQPAEPDGGAVPGSKNFDKTGPFVVPADSVLLSLTDEGLQLFVANMERKLRLARQEVLVRTYGRPPQL